jgi:protein-L-isoaspartate(D-aspartate) O-methyltransferase
MSDFSARRTMMVDTQGRPNDVTKFPVIEAMLAIPREEFVPASRRAVAYSGENVEIAKDRVLLEPRTLAKMVDALDIQPTDLVLDLACGYGYSSAVMARMAEAVVAIEDDADMVAEAERRLAETNVFNVAVIQAELAVGARSKRCLPPFSNS